MSTLPPLTRISSLVFGAVLIATLNLGAQQPSSNPSAPLPAYDVVAIHENKSGTNMSSARWGDDAFRATNTTLSVLLMNAYGIRDELISGLPSWASSFHFDINAKISDPDIDAVKKLTREQRRTMIALLLKERFLLRAHIEVKTLPVYDLVIARGGPKLREDTASPATSLEPGRTPSAHPPGSFMISDREMIGVAIPISALASNLGFRLERNVIDKTGLAGKYDINLKWTPPEQEGKPDGLTDNNAPDIFTALQEQLGLKLEPSKGPVDTLVIDHVEMPSAN